MEDLDFEHDVARVIGKGRRERALPFGRTTAVALDRYLRVRSRHAHAASPWLWLGQNGPLTATGLAQMLWRRGRQAGVEACMRTNCATPSPTPGSPRADLRPTSCRSLADGRARCSSATPRCSGTSATCGARPITVLICIPGLEIRLAQPDILLGLHDPGQPWEKWGCPIEGCGRWFPGPWYLEGHTTAEHPGWTATYELLRPYPNQRQRVVYRRRTPPVS